MIKLLLFIHLLNSLILIFVLILILVPLSIIPFTVLRLPVSPRDGHLINLTHYPLVIAPNPCLEGPQRINSSHNPLGVGDFLDLSVIPQILRGRYVHRHFVDLLQNELVCSNRSLGGERSQRASCAVVNDNLPAKE